MVDLDEYFDFVQSKKFKTKSKKKQFIHYNKKGISTDDLESIYNTNDELKLWIEFLQKNPDSSEYNIKNDGFQNFYYMELSPSLKDKAIESGFPIAKLKQPQSPLLV